VRPCGSTNHGDATNNRRRIRHACRPACGPSATYRAERFEDQLGRLFDRVQLTELDVSEVLSAIRGATVEAIVPDLEAIGVERSQLQAQFAAGSLILEVFSRAWRRLDRPAALDRVQPDELRLRRGGRVLSDFGTLWRNPSVPDQLREAALAGILGRIDVDGPEIVAVHPAPNENAWLLGLVAVREQRLQAQPEVGLVGARGIAPP